MTPRGWALFAAMSIVWGIPYLLIKVALDDGVPPLFVAWSRVAVAAVLLMILAWRAGLLSSLRGRGWAILAYAVPEIVFPFPLIAAGERHVASSLAAIIIASVPLIIALLAVRFDEAERVTGSRLAGLFIGMAGVVALVGIDVAGKPDELLGAVAILVAAVGYAIGPLVLRRRLTDLDPRATMGASLVVAGLILTPFAAIDPPTAVPSLSASLALAGLGVVCTAAAFVIFGHLIAEVGPSRSLVITYVNPVIALALGVAILGERPGIGTLAGLVLILLGSWLSTRGGRPAPGHPRSQRSSSRAQDRTPVAR